MNAYLIVFICTTILAGIYTAMTRRVILGTVFLSWVVFPIMNRKGSLDNWTMAAPDWPPQTLDMHRTWYSSLPVLFGWRGWKLYLHHALGCDVCVSGWVSLLLCCAASVCCLVLFAPPVALVPLAAWPVAWYLSIRL